MLLCGGQRTAHQGQGFLSRLPLWYVLQTGWLWGLQLALLALPPIWRHVGITDVHHLVGFFTWVPGIKLTLLGMHSNAFTHELLRGPGC